MGSGACQRKGLAPTLGNIKASTTTRLDDAFSDQSVIGFYNS